MSHSFCFQFSSANLSVAVNDVFAAGQFLQSHGAAGVHLLRRDTDFGSQTKLAAVGKPGRGVDVHGSAVHAGGENCLSFFILRDNGPGIKDIEQAMQEGFSTATDNIRSLGFGAGMGLPNMKRYSDYMHIESHPGEGTTITMRVNIN